MTVSVSAVLRSTYLAALGIPQLRARQVLPGAAPSRPEVISEVPRSVRSVPVPPAPALEPPVSATAAGAERELPAPRELKHVPTPLSMQPAPAHLRVPAEPALVAPAPPSPPSPAPAASLAPDPAIPRFSCQLYRLAEGQWALVDLEDHPGLEGPERMLWQGIQRAMGWRAEAVASAFVWPRAVTPGTLFLAPDADSARTVLSAWLQRDVPAGERLWVLGEPLAAFVERPHRAMPALTDCLRDPLRKRLLWQQLTRGD